MAQKRCVKKVWVKTFCENFVKCMSEKRWVKSMGENFKKSMGENFVKSKGERDG